MRSCLFAAAVMSLFATPALAQSGNVETRTGTIRAQVVRPLVLSHWSGFALRFGRFTAGTTPGTVVITASGGATATGGTTFVSGSTTATDRLIARGEPNRLISITTGPGSVSNGSATMSFTTVPSLPAGFIPAAGAGFFTVGGTLSVPSGQAPGNYTGTYPVTVSYN